MGSLVTNSPAEASGIAHPQPGGAGGLVTTRRRDQPFLHVLREIAAQMDAPTIELVPERVHGKPTVAGTRLPVSVVLTYVAAGYTLAQVAEEFSGVTVEQLRGAVEFAAEVLDQDVGA
jgi:uncharacterized protein (DUF433 family)